MIFDLSVLAIVLLSTLLGLLRGFVHAVLSLIGWPVALVLSRIFAADIEPLLPIHQEAMRSMAAYALVFICVLLIWGVLVWLLSRLIKLVGLGGVDSVLGGFFGVVRGALLVLVLVWLAGMTHLPERPFWRKANLSRTAEDIALQTKHWLPDNLARRIHYRKRK